MQRRQAVVSDADNEQVADDDDESSQTSALAEYEAWRRREAARIKRRHGSSLLVAIDGLVGKEDNPCAPPPNSNKRKRMRHGGYRHHGRGCFFQDTDNHYPRHDDEQVAEEAAVAVSPNMVAQAVDIFGRHGRTKWTRLVNEDTTYQRNSLQPHRCCSS